MAYTPFSSGARKCPGQVLANIEAKVLIAVFALKMNYDVDKEQLKNDNIKFNVVSSYHLKVLFKGKN